MRVNEVAADTVQEPNKLVGLVNFLRGRADDTSSKQQISQTAFIKLAQQLGISVTADNIENLVNQPPLSNLLEPYDASSQTIVFKGATESSPKMPVDRAQDIVGKMAKRATKKAI